MTGEKLKEQIARSIAFCGKMEEVFNSDEESGYCKRIACDLTELRQRLEKRKLYVLVSGEVKMGKSSTINNILNEDVCAVDQSVCTNSVSLIGYGEEEKVVIHFFPTEENPDPVPEEVSRSQLNDYISERNNPDNDRNVRLVEIYLPNQVLKQGLVLIDTPGLGAIEPKHAIATYGIAPIADIILFLTNSMMPITTSELDHLRRLSECSKCENILQIMTRADEGAPDLLLEENKRHIKEKLPNLNVKYFKISNSLYSDYKRLGDSDDLGESGFDELFSEIERISGSIQEMLDKKCSAQLSAVLCRLYDDLKSVAATASNPTEAEKRMDKLNELISRIQELQSSSNAWRYSLAAKMSHLQNNIVNSWLQDQKIEMFRELDNYLEDVFYLKNPDSLGYELQTKMMEVNSGLKSLFSDQAGEMYNQIILETGFEGIRNEIHDNEIKARANVEITDPSSFSEKVHNLRISVMSVSGGAAIGAYIGSFFGPGLGTAIGAVLGAFTGWLSSKFISNERRRHKIKEQAAVAINAYFSKLLSSLTNVFIDFQRSIKTSFEQELANELAACRLQKSAIEGAIADNNAYREKLGNVLKELNAITEAVKNDE